MGMPFKLKNFNCFANGKSWAGLVPEVQLPKLAKKVEQYRGGGMLGEVDAEMGLEKLEAEIKLGGLSRQALSMFGAIGIEGVSLRFVGAYQSDETGGVMASELVMGGMFTEIDPGSAKVGDNTEMPIKATLNYLKWSINGRTDVEIDMLRCVWIQDGFDRMATIRAAIQV